MKQTLPTAILFVAAGFSFGQTNGHTFTGEIMDKQCAQMGSHENMMHAVGAKDAKDCTLACAKNGDKLVLFDSNAKKVYVIEDEKNAVAARQIKREKRIAPDMVLIGEVGLSGELRAVSRLGMRVREAAKLGFKRCIVPKAGGGTQIRAELEGSGLPADFEIFASSSLAVALEVALH